MDTYVIAYEGPYGKGSMIFEGYNKAQAWVNQMMLAGNIRGTLYRLCKRHAPMMSSFKHGKCCKKVLEF